MNEFETLMVVWVLIVVVLVFGDHPTFQAMIVVVTLFAGLVWLAVEALP